MEAIIKRHLLTVLLTIALMAGFVLMVPFGLNPGLAFLFVAISPALALFIAGKVFPGQNLTLREPKKKR